jgi:Kyanoviridae NAD synthetase
LTWIYQFKEFTEVPKEVVGFVYCITNLLDGRRYIGKKSVMFSRLTKTIKKRKKRIKFESDWRDYWSSSEAVKQDVDNYGHHNFRREIIHLCTSKSQLNYLELREQMDRRVLETNDYYNEYIQVRIKKCHTLTHTTSTVEGANLVVKKEKPRRSLTE